jgi:hypothetical protein
MKIQTLSPERFLDPTHRDIASASLADGTIDHIEIPVGDTDAIRLAPQLSSFLQTDAVRQPLAELQRLNLPIGNLRFDLSMKTILDAAAARKGVDLTPAYQGLTTKKEITKGADGSPREKTILQGVLLGGAAGVFLQTLIKASAGNAALSCLALAVVGGIVWPHAKSLELILKPSGDVSAKIGL